MSATLEFSSFSLDNIEFDYLIITGNYVRKYSKLHIHSSLSLDGLRYSDFYVVNRGIKTNGKDLLYPLYDESDSILFEVLEELNSSKYGDNYIILIKKEIHMNKTSNFKFSEHNKILKSVIDEESCPLIGYNIIKLSNNKRVMCIFTEDKEW